MFEYALVTWNNLILADSDKPENIFKYVHIYVMVHFMCLTLFTIRVLRSRDSSVSIVTGYGLDGKGSILGRGKSFSSPQHPDQLCSSPSFLYKGYLGRFPWG
jgi:hypothetical protein